MTADDEPVFTLRLDEELVFTLRLLLEAPLATLLELVLAACVVERPDVDCTLLPAVLAVATVLSPDLDATVLSGVLTVRLLLEPDTARRSDVLRLKLRSHPAPLILRLGVK